MASKIEKTTELSWLFNFESTASLCLALGTIEALLVSHGILSPGPVTAFFTRCFLPLQLPVFYFAYGYLYQRRWRVRSMAGWRLSMVHELVYLFVPLIAVTIPTLLINGWTGGGPAFSLAEFLKAITWYPVIPVGFFLVVLPFYCFIPTLASDRGCLWVLGVTGALKLVSCGLALGGLAPEAEAVLPYLAFHGLGSVIWFAGGMVLCYLLEKDRSLFSRSLGGWLCRRWYLGWTLWLGAAVAFLALQVPPAITETVLTAWGLLVGSGLYYRFWAPKGRQWRFFGFIDGYTKGIWLMHPMFLAAWATAMAGTGILGTVGGTVVFVLGTFVVAYVLPVVVNQVMDRVGKLGFLINPDKYYLEPPLDQQPEA